MVSPNTVIPGLGGTPQVSVGGRDGLRVRFARPVLEEIRRTAVDRFLAIPRGGLEIGGVLFGGWDADGAAVWASEPLECEYLTGPSFTLSAADEDRLKALLAAPRGDGAVPVGWYHTHTRSDLSFSDADAKVHSHFFREPQQIALIIKPHKFDPAEAVIYTDVVGPIAASAAAAQFTIAPWSPEEAGTSDLISEPERVGTTTPPPFVEPDAETKLVPSRPFFRFPDPVVVKARRRQRMVRTAAVLVLSALGTAGILLTAARYMPSHREAAQLGLQVAGPGPTLTISWNPEAVPDREVQTAELMIVDGGYAPTMVPLAVEELRRGSLNYVRSSGNVEVRLRLHRTDGKLQQHVARFLSGAPVIEEQRAAVTPVVTERPADPPAHAVAPVPAAPSSNREVKQESERARQRLTVVPPPQPQQERKVAQPLMAAADLPVSSMGLPQPALPTAQLPPPPPQQQPAPAQQAKPAAGTPKASGRAIWTGRLGPEGVLLIDGGRPSSGALSGRIPARMSRVRVHAADLVDSGIVVYAERSGIEAPSAANGWNLTTYRPDPKRARTVSVLEQPSAQNGYRLMVRAEGKRVTMIVIDWQE